MDGNSENIAQISYCCRSNKNALNRSNYRNHSTCTPQVISHYMSIMGVKNLTLRSSSTAFNKTTFSIYVGKAVRSPILVYHICVDRSWWDATDLFLKKEDTSGLGIDVLFLVLVLLLSLLHLGGGQLQLLKGFFHRTLDKKDRWYKVARCTKQN